jgi:hypothetical protein
MDLVTIQGRHKVAASAAPSLLAWIKRITEIDGKAPAITEIYRSPAEQDRLYNGWIARKKGFNPAYKSTDKRARHIHGLAIDWGFQGRKTARATAHEFGWTFNVDGEEWHAEKTGPAPSDTVTASTLEKVLKSVLENDMLIIRGKNKSILVGPRGFTDLNKVQMAAFSEAKSVPVENVSDAAYDQILSAIRDARPNYF